MSEPNEVLYEWKDNGLRLCVSTAEDDRLTCCVWQGGGWREVSPTHADPHLLRQLVRLKKRGVEDAYIFLVRAAGHAQRAYYDGTHKTVRRVGELWLYEDGELAITGQPNSSGHNCDEMECTSMSHIIARYNQRLTFDKNAPPEATDAE